MQPQENAGDPILQEIQFYRQNHIILEDEIRKLIEDNKRLSDQVDNLLKERVELTSLRRNKETEHNVLLTQIATITKERESLTQLWQTSQTTVEALESELKTYQEEFYSSKSIPLTREIQKSYNTALEQIQELENKIKCLAESEKSLEMQIKNKEELIKKLENKVDEATKYRDSSTENERKFEYLIEKIQKELENYKNGLNISQRKEIEATCKVQEALDLLEVITGQKDDACMKLAACTEELSLLKRSACEVTSELENRLQTELDEMREKYEEKVSDMLKHIQTMDVEIVEKGGQLAALQRENRILKKANRTFEKLKEEQASATDPRLQVAEQKLEAVFQELVLSERRNIRLACEKSSLAMESERRGRDHDRLLKKTSWQETLMWTHNKYYKLQLDHLQKSLEEADSLIDNLQRLLSEKASINIRSSTCKEDEVTVLNEHIQNQIELNKKWRQSYVEMTEKLKKRLDELREENKALKSKTKQYSSHIVDLYSSVAQS